MDGGKRSGILKRHNEIFYKKTTNPSNNDWNGFLSVTIEI